MFRCVVLVPSRPNPHPGTDLLASASPQTTQSDRNRSAMDDTRKVQYFNDRIHDYKQTYDGHY